MAHMVKRLTNEGSTFLGEKIIEVRRVGPPQEVWYKLGKALPREMNSNPSPPPSLSPAPSKMNPDYLFHFTEKRSIKEQEVSGHIKVNISATIDGEEIRTPFHEQYTKLHEVKRKWEREREGEREWVYT